MANTIRRFASASVITFEPMILYGVTIVTSAFLLFLVQPIIAKQILPWFGGSAAVWTTCVVFFQAVLLAGYAYAHALGKRSARTQGTVHALLLLASVATLPIIASDAWKPLPASDPAFRIVGLLVATVGLPYFLLSSTGPLLQRWFADDPSLAALRPRVYRLFALSNLGSLVGLLAYPFIVEPFAPLATQSWGWSAAYVVFVVACGFCAWRVRRRASPVSADADADEAGERPSVRRYAYWLACAALGSSLLLSLTNHITQNVASIPFLWIVPLTLYLSSFVVVFEGRGGRGWYSRRAWLLPVLVANIAMAWALSANQGVLSIYIAIPIFSIGLFLACVFCHGELAAAKPAPAYLTHFYLSLSAGGAIGGLFVALAAPRLFDNYWETPLSIAGVSVLALIAVRERRIAHWLLGAGLGAIVTTLVFLAADGPPLASARATLPGHASSALTAALIAIAVLLLAFATWRRWTMTVVVAALACSFYYGARYYTFLSDDTLYASRNFYGALRVKEGGAGEFLERRLMHGVILHGDQWLAPDKRRMPTSYYGPGSGIALALRELKGDDHRALEVAMVGLGAGTLVAWGQPGDHYTIYELNPSVPTLARTWFTYLADAKAATTIELGDARLSMERELASGHATAYDVIAVDAFSSDAIPVHLITREALAVYLRHLRPDGVVAFHVSNRYLRLAPVVLQLANDAGLDAINVSDDPEDDDTYSPSDWVLVTRNQAFLDRDEVLDRSEEIVPIAGLRIWTDQFNNLFEILK